MKFKEGDKVRVKTSVTDPVYGWGEVGPDDVGVVVTVEEDGDMIIDFPSQEGWMGYVEEMKLVKEPRKSPEKVLAYGVLNKDGALVAVYADRDFARSKKASLGGKQNGVTIVVLQSGKEIR